MATTDSDNLSQTPLTQRDIRLIIFGLLNPPAAGVADTAG